MSDGYEVEPDRLAGQQAQLDPIAGRVTSIHQTLTAALAEAGACWGSDAVGQSFAAAHASPADSTLAQLGALPGQLGSVGDRFTATAATYEGDDQHGARRLRAAGPDLTEA
ncbi:MAG TPA: hypothetical protein VH969_17670 [Actinophytocola sp.]|jgi:hypothetical protein|uniref:hypothetical protein n=1 Tax=Actinophytocola sp. TaxID=1872138 RepID=UPI002F94CADC